MNNTFLEPDVEQAPHGPFDLLHQTKDGWIATMPVQNVEFFGTFRALDWVIKMIHDLPINLYSTPPYRVARTGCGLSLPTTDELAAALSEDVPYSLIMIVRMSSMTPRWKRCRHYYLPPPGWVAGTPRPAAQYRKRPATSYLHPAWASTTARFCQNWVRARHKSHHCKRLMLSSRTVQRTDSSKLQLRTRACPNTTATPLQAHYGTNYFAMLKHQRARGELL